MERLDFCSVMTIICKYINENRYTNQSDLIHDYLFPAYKCNDPFDNGSICRWFNGQKKVSPQITSYYLNEPKGISILAEGIEDNLLTIIYDIGNAMNELKTLLLQDASISEIQKKELLDTYDDSSPEGQASFIANILLFALERNFVPREKNALQVVEASKSPALADYIYENSIPKPCKFFCGRDTELNELHTALTTHKHVFLHGIAGIGKSELAKAYANKYKKEYTNILYLVYSGDLISDITEMDFADDLSTDSKEDKFKKHNRFLRSLKEDTLIIIDNFNTSTNKDSFLDVLLKYKCCLLFTTRSRISDNTSYELSEITNRDALITLYGNLYSDTDNNRDIIEKILDEIHCHTLAVELSARLLQSGLLEPTELLSKLQAEHVALSSSDIIGIKKDGTSTRATYYNHIHMLFSLYNLSDVHTAVMRAMAMVPYTGINSKLLAKWLCQSDMNSINELIELGFIKPIDNRTIALHPMMQEITIADTKPSISNLSVMLDYITENIFKLPGIDITYYRTLFSVIENIIIYADKDNTPKYLTFIEDAFNCMDKYSYISGMNLIVTEMESILADNTTSNVSDQILLLDYKATLAVINDNNIKAAIRFEDKALSILPELSESTALLISNINANMGSFYRMNGEMKLAASYMEKGISILETYNLIHMNESIAQICNYATLLQELNRPDVAISALRKCARLIKASSSDTSLDYARVKETEGYTHLAIGELPLAQKCLKTAMTIYENTWNDEGMIEDKYREIAEAYAATGISFARKMLE